MRDLLIFILSSVGLVCGAVALFFWLSTEPIRVTLSSGLTMYCESHYTSHRDLRCPIHRALCYAAFETAQSIIKHIRTAKNRLDEQDKNAQDLFTQTKVLVADQRGDR